MSGGTRHMRQALTGLLLTAIIMMTVICNWTTYSDTLADVEQESGTRACSQKFRRNLLRATCPMYHKESVRNLTGKVVTVYAVNHEKKIFFCALPKSGSKAWYNYMVNLTGRAPPPPWNVRDNDFMDRVGLESRKRVPLEEVVRLYKNYTKFTVARHPLQWLVATYYEAIVKVHRYPHEDGSLPSLGEFMRNLDTYDWYQKQWKSFESSCHHCVLDYDYIIKAETLEDDIMVLQRAFDSVVSPPVLHVNSRYNASQVADTYKYDPLLHELERNYTGILREMFRKYHKEFVMFGYQYDFRNNQSMCSNWEDGNQCC